MKKIVIHIIELEDIIRIINNIVDKIKFIFSKPKYQIDTKVQYYGDYKITKIYRDWEFNIWIYELNNSSILSEGLIAFYKNENS